MSGTGVVRHRAADHPGPDGRRAGQRACGRRLERRRSRLAAVRDARFPQALRVSLPRSEARRAGRATLISLSCRAAARRERGSALACRARAVLPRIGIDPATIKPGPGRAPFSAGMPRFSSRNSNPRSSFSLRTAFRSAARARGRLRGGCSRRQLPWPRRAGSKRAESMRSLRRGSKWVGTRGVFLADDLTTQVGTLSRWCRRSSAQCAGAGDAAGGIADARGVEAVLALGAAGVQVGTA